MLLTQEKLSLSASKVLKAYAWQFGLSNFAHELFYSSKVLIDLS